MLSKFAQYFWGFLSNLWNGAMQFLGSLVQNLLNGIGSLLQALFKPIFDLITAIFYFIQQLVTMVELLFQLLVSVFHVLFSFIEGLLTTMLQLSYNNSSPVMPGDLRNDFTQMQPVFGLLQLDNLAYVLHFAVWLITAFAVVRMLGNFGSGGGGS